MDRIVIFGIRATFRTEGTFLDEDGHIQNYSRSNLYTPFCKIYTGVYDKGFVELWAIKISLKVKIFVWLVLKCRVLIMDMLLSCGWFGSSNCALCSCPVETADHLFATREVACDSKIAVGSEHVQTGFPWEKETFYYLRHLGGLFGKLEQNRRHFKSMFRNPGNLYADIRSLTAACTAFCA